MLFRRLRRIFSGLDFYGRTRAKRGKRRFRALFAAFALLIMAIVFLFRLRPIVSKMALAAASDSVTKAVNTAVNEKVSDGSMDYGDLIRLEKDFDGHVSALTTNMPKINLLETQIVSRVIELVGDKRVSELSVPVGNLIGGNMFSGRGFGIPVRIVSIGATAAKFSNRFSAAGINQTRHQIILAVTVELNVLIPTGSVKTSVSCEFSVAETVIVGSVPESYTFFEDNSQFETALDKYDIAS